MAALAYSRTLLLSITAKCCQIRLDNTLWRVLKVNGIARTTTIRGCRAGKFKQRTIKTVHGLGKYDYNRPWFPISNYKLINNNHCTLTPVASHRNLITVDCSNDVEGESLCINRVTYVPSILLSNTMSLAPKIDEIRHSVVSTNIDIASFTETWLSDSIQDTIIQIPGYNIARKDRLIGRSMFIY
jgi:hypothetical protein